ncbi:MAG: phage tail protein I [Eubacterium sp.]|nr:phage tail protein I [Eubacterium sp.]
MTSPKGIRETGRDIYTANFADFLPKALKQDARMRAIAEAVTKEALAVSGEMENVLIYSRIDELPEALIDILAYDMHIDWYDYSYPLNVKRDILKNGVKVHKKMGTKYAVEKALGALYPQSEVEEWNQYNGKPHHFRIVCDVTENRVTASFQEIVNAVNMYKRLSSHMEEVVYQARAKARVETHTDFFRYKNPATGNMLAGTYPHRIRKGAQSGNRIAVGTKAVGVVFVSKRAGTHPYRSCMYGNADTQIDAETSFNAYKHRNAYTGRIRAGEKPKKIRWGSQIGMIVEAKTETEGKSFSVPATGTKPGKTMKKGGVASMVKAEGFKHTARPCGTGRKL